MAQTVSEIQVEPTLKGIYAAMDVDMIQIAYTDLDDEKKHTLYVDEEGLYRAKGMFQIGDTQPLCNRGLVMLENGEDTLDATMTVEEVEAKVKWIPEVMIPVVLDQILSIPIEVVAL
jgi:hypothetical protein